MDCQCDTVGSACPNPECQRRYNQIGMTKGGDDMKIRILVPNANADLPYQVWVEDISPFDPSSWKGMQAAFRHRGDAQLFKQELERRMAPQR